MLNTPRLLGADVCIRCELRILQRILRAPEPYTSPSVTFSTTAFRSTEPESTQESHTRHDRKDPDYGKFEVKHIRPQGRIRGRRGKEVREETAQLDIDSLGRPSEIIVLKQAHFGENDPTRRRTTKSQVETGRQSAPSTTSQHILRSMEDEKSAPTQEAVNADIEKLRQSVLQACEGTSMELPNSHLQDVYAKLMESYSLKQLWNYIAQTRKLLPTSSDADGRSAPGASSLKRSEWLAGRHNTMQRLWTRSKLLRERQDGPKKTLPAILVGICWGIWPSDLEGDLELQLNPRLMELLNAGSKPSVLDRVGRQEEVSFVAIDHYLRIRGTHRRTSNAADILTALLDGVKSRTLNLTGMSGLIESCRGRDGSFFSRSYLLRHLGHLRVSINDRPRVHKQDGNPDVASDERLLTLLSFDEAELDHVQQALLQLFNVPKAGSTSLPTVKQNGITTFVPVDTTEVPDLRVGQELYRSIAGHSPEGAARDDETEHQLQGIAQGGAAPCRKRTDVQTHQIDAPLLAYKCNLNASRSSHEQSQLGWQKGLRPSLNATLGLELHTSAHQAAPGSMGLSRFVPVGSQAFPWILRTSKEKQLLTKISAPENQLRFNFIATPFLGHTPVPLARYAHVSLVFDYDQNAGKHIFSHWSADLGNASLVLPLPHLAMDLRLTKAYELLSKEEGNNEQQQCIKHIQTSIDQGGTLSAPSAIQLHAPCLLESRSSYPEQEADAQPDQWSDNIWGFGSEGPTQYLYSGVELQQRLRMQWASSETDSIETRYPLMYTMTDSGKIGGRSSEITLTVPDAAIVDNTTSEAAEKRSRFYDAAMRLAKEITTATAVQSSSPVN